MEVDTSHSVSRAGDGNQSLRASVEEARVGGMMIGAVAKAGDLLPFLPQPFSGNRVDRQDFHLDARLSRTACA